MAKRGSNQVLKWVFLAVVQSRLWLRRIRII